MALECVGRNGDSGERGELERMLVILSDTKCRFQLNRRLSHFRVRFFQLNRRLSRLFSEKS